MKMMRELVELVMEKIQTTDGYKRGWLERNWNEILGDFSGRHCAPGRLSNDILFMKVDSPVWTYNLFIRKQEMIRKINAAYGKVIVKDIKYQAGGTMKDFSSEKRKAETEQKELKRKGNFFYEDEKKILQLLFEKKSQSKEKEKI